MTLAEALRIVKPGGKVVIFDYHRPKIWHPLRLPVRAVLSRLEPFALDLWRNDLAEYFPEQADLSQARRQTYFGGLYQKLVLTC
jgi:ubiquinone/menaquinone biosynthesis C-methylase UbiE